MTSPTTPPTSRTPQAPPAAKAAPHPEKRAATRIPIDLRVHVRSPTGREEVLLTHDLSARGLFLRTHSPPPVGAPLDMFAVVGAPARKVSLRGRVVRVRREDRMSAQPHLPPGIAVALDTLPVELKRFIEESTQRSLLTPGMEDPVAPAEVVEEVLLVGGDHPARERLARMLTAAGYAIAQADSPAGATAFLQEPAPPEAVIVIADTSDTISALARQPGLLRASVVVSLGMPPTGLGSGLDLPLVVLPRMYPIGRLPGVLRLFAPESSAMARVLPRDELPPARAW